MLQCLLGSFFTYMNIKFYSIPILTVCQNPELQSPLSRLIFHVLPSTQPMLGLHHTFIHRQLLGWLIQKLAPFFERCKELFSLPQFLARSLIVGVNNMQKSRDSLITIPRKYRPCPQTMVNGFSAPILISVPTLLHKPKVD